MEGGREGGRKGGREGGSEEEREGGSEGGGWGERGREGAAGMCDVNAVGCMAAAWVRYWHDVPIIFALNKTCLASYKYMYSNFEIRLR